LSGFEGARHQFCSPAENFPYIGYVLTGNGLQLLADLVIPISGEVVVRFYSGGVGYASASLDGIPNQVNSLAYGANSRHRGSIITYVPGDSVA
jgi:hypothetical protein